MFYIYGLSNVAEDIIASCLHDRQGLQAPLEHAAVADWTLIYSEHDNQEILPKRKNLLIHTRTLELVLPLGSILPARFGLIANDVAQIARLIGDQSEQIAKAFDRVQGAVELGVRVSFPRQAAIDATLREDPALSSERDYLSKKSRHAHFEVAEFGGRLADQLDRRRGLAQRSLLSALLPLVKDHVLRKPEDDTEVLRAEFLIDSQMQISFEKALAAYCAELNFAPGEEPLIQVIGPVPMYNFVSLNLPFDRDKVAA